MTVSGQKPMALDSRRTESSGAVSRDRLPRMTFATRWLLAIGAAPMLRGYPYPEVL